MRKKIFCFITEQNKLLCLECGGANTKGLFPVGKQTFLASVYEGDCCSLCSAPIWEKYITVFGSKKSSKYYYWVDLDERGYFKSRLDDALGNTIFRISIDPFDNHSVFDDGWIKNGYDITGIQNYLSELKLINSDSQILLEN